MYTVCCVIQELLFTLELIFSIKCCITKLLAFFFIKKVLFLILFGENFRTSQQGIKKEK